MGTDYFLCCKNCEKAMHLGRKISKRDGSLVMQGGFSEKSLDWLSADLTWMATQRFLQIHEGHELLFTNDHSFPPVQIYEHTEVDELLEKQSNEQH